MSGYISVIFLSVLLQNHCALVVLYHDVLLNFNNLSIQTNLVHNTIIMTSSAAYNSANVFIIVFNIFFLGIDITATFPIVIFIPVWLLKYGCTSNAASAS